MSWWMVGSLLMNMHEHVFLIFSGHIYYKSRLDWLTAHWGWVTHMCVSATYQHCFRYRESGTFIPCRTVTRDADWAGKTRDVVECLAAPSLHRELPSDTGWTCLILFLTYQSTDNILNTYKSIGNDRHRCKNKTAQNRPCVGISGPNVADQCTQKIVPWTIIETTTLDI